MSSAPRWAGNSRWRLAFVFAIKCVPPGRIAGEYRYTLNYECVVLRIFPFSKSTHIALVCKVKPLRIYLLSRPLRRVKLLPNLGVWSSGRTLGSGPSSEGSNPSTPADCTADSRSSDVCIEWRPDLLNGLIFPWPGLCAGRDLPSDKRRR